MGNGSSSGRGVVDQLTEEAMAQCGCKRCITREMNNPTKSLNSVSKIDRLLRAPPNPCKNIVHMDIQSSMY